MDTSAQISQRKVKNYLNSDCQFFFRVFNFNFILTKAKKTVLVQGVLSILRLQLCF